MRTKTEATVDDLYRVSEHGKAEIVNGELVLMSPTGGVPGRAAGKIYVSLRDYERRIGGGYDYFAAGTLVIWDVDVLREKVVRVYRASDPQNPTVYGTGEVAEAEPTLRDWAMPVDNILN